MKAKLKFLLLPVLALLITSSSFAQRPDDSTITHYLGRALYDRLEHDLDSSCATMPNCDNKKDTINDTLGICCSWEPATFVIKKTHYCPPPDTDKVHIYTITIIKCKVINDMCRILQSSYSYTYRCPGDTIIYDSIPPYPPYSFKKDHEIKELEDLLSRRTSQTSFGVISQAIEITAYPNPASNAIILRSDGDIYVESISLINIMGQEVKKLNLNTVLSPNNSNTVDISDVPNGIYSVVSKTPEGLKTYIISINH